MRSLLESFTALLYRALPWGPSPSSSATSATSATHAAATSSSPAFRRVHVQNWGYVNMEWGAKRPGAAVGWSDVWWAAQVASLCWAALCLLCLAWAAVLAPLWGWAARSCHCGCRGGTGRRVACCKDASRGTRSTARGRGGGGSSERGSSLFSSLADPPWQLYSVPAHRVRAGTGTGAASESESESASEPGTLTYLLGTGWSVLF